MDQSEDEKKEYIAAPAPNEQVVAPPKPPRARVSDVIDDEVESPRETMERKRDYLCLLYTSPSPRDRG